MRCSRASRHRRWSQRWPGLSTRWCSPTCSSWSQRSKSRQHCRRSPVWRWRRWWWWVQRRRSNRNTLWRVGKRNPALWSGCRLQCKSNFQTRRNHKSQDPLWQRLNKDSTKSWGTNINTLNWFLHCQLTDTIVNVVLYCNNSRKLNWI